MRIRDGKSWIRDPGRKKSDPGSGIKKSDLGKTSWIRNTGHIHRKKGTQGALSPLLYA
jgi:hypothetical protein